LEPDFQKGDDVYFGRRAQSHSPTTIMSFMRHSDADSGIDRRYEVVNGSRRINGTYDEIAETMRNEKWSNFKGWVRVLGETE